MSTQRFDLTVEPREQGRKTARSLRRNRAVPAVIYGSIKNKNLSIDLNSVVKYNASAFENALFNLKSNSDKELNSVVALIKDVVVHPVTRLPVHVDLFALDLKKPVRVFVEIKLEGKPAGLADGGILNVVNRQIEVECLPLEIPSFLTADVSALGLNDSLHASSIQMPKGVKQISSADLTIAVVTELEDESVSAAAAPAAAAPAAAGAKPAAAPAAGAKPAAAPAKAPAAKK